MGGTSAGRGTCSCVVRTHPRPPVRVTCPYGQVFFPVTISGLPGQPLLVKSDHLWLRPGGGEMAGG